MANQNDDDQIDPVHPNRTVSVTIGDLTKIQNRLAGLEAKAQQTFPVGTIIATLKPEGAALSGWLECNGDPIPAGDEYDAIRSLIEGLSVGSDVEKDHTPDLRGQFLRGLDSRPVNDVGRVDAMSPRVLGSKVEDYIHEHAHLLFVDQGGDPVAPAIHPSHHHEWGNDDNYRIKIRNGAADLGASDTKILIKNQESFDPPLVPQGNAGAVETSPKNFAVTYFIKV